MIRRTLLRSNALKMGAACLLLSIGAGCGSDDGANPVGGGAGDGGASGDSGRLADGRVVTTPTVISTLPLSGAAGVPLNGSVNATFSEDMDAASLNSATFTVTSGAAAVPGTVIHSKSSATFWPSARLAASAMFTATISTAAKSSAGAPLAANYSWNFTTGTTLAPGLGVNLGTSGAFVILSKSGISTVPPSTITGDIGVSPIKASAITGFDLMADMSNVFSTTAQVSGKVYASDYAPPTPANLTTAVGDMETAFTDAASRAPDVTELGAGNIGGRTLVPGVYKWGTGLLIPSDVTLAGSATDVWIFQIAQNLTMSSATKVLMSGGAAAKNVFWQVSGMVDLDTTAHCEGIVLSQTQIVLRTGSTIKGRLLAQTAVTLAGSTVEKPE